ncbi:MAG: RNA polymerase sigma factor [Pseudomonadota bacterium]
MAYQDGDGRFASYLDYRLALIKYVTPIIGSRADAEDIVQEVFIRFYPKNATITGSARAYLFKIAHNLALDWARRKKLESRLNAEDLPQWVQPQDVGTPEKTVLVGDELRRITEFLDTCPEQNRIVVEMYRFGGCTMEQIAEHLDLSVSSVHRILRKTMASLAELMDQED